MLQIGLEVFRTKAYRDFKKLRLGVLCNQASVDNRLIHIRDIITDKRLGLNVTCFIGPQHGIRGEKQDNMVESDDFIDQKYQVPVYSLYGKYREPQSDILSRIDAFVVDLQDIGTRIYTFMYTMANCMRAARAAGKKVIVLDRPNPIDGLTTDGNVLDPEFASFVGQYPLCVRHGMTLGELALLFNEHFGIGCDLEIIKMKGWRRDSHADQWGREWIAPSPNIPRYQSALTFPGGVLFEGTLLSEGRGTTLPFETIGAPFIEADKLAAHMNQLKLPGVFFRSIFFQPTYQKCKDQVCGGVYVHVTDRRRYQSFRSGLKLLAAIHDLYPKAFAWKQPPYEYEHKKMPIDLIAGTSALREAVEAGTVGKFESRAGEELAKFRKIRKSFLLYASKR